MEQDARWVGKSCAFVMACLLSVEQSPSPGAARPVLQRWDRAAVKILTRRKLRRIGWAGHAGIGGYACGGCGHVDRLSA